MPRKTFRQTQHRAAERSDNFGVSRGFFAEIGLTSPRFRNDQLSAENPPQPNVAVAYPYDTGGIISKVQSEACYEYGKRVHEGSITLLDARDKMNQGGMNGASALYLIFAVTQMLQGRTYRRTTSIFTARIFLEPILRDFGKQGLENALHALMGNIDFRQKTKRDSCVGLRKLHKEFSTLLD